MKKKMNKRLYAVILSAAMAFTTVCPAMATESTDAAALYEDVSVEEEAEVLAEEIYAPGFDEDKAFMLRVIEGARQKLGWETLGYEPNEEFVAEYLDTFQKLIERMTAEDIIEESLTEWLSEADENDPTRCGFPKCKIHDAYISIHGCQVCID